MDKLWKWIMHLNAKAFCLMAILLFFITAVWCGFNYKTPPEPFKEGSGSREQLPSENWNIGTLDFVSNQLSAETLTIPFDPFRPTIEAILTNETERVAFLKALKAAQEAASGLGGGKEAGAKKEDPFAHLRKKETVPGALVGPDGKPMVVPKISFLGYFQRSDGTRAAMFHNSVDNSLAFYETGNPVHGLDIINANVNAAEVRLPDGTTRDLKIGESVELAPEPAAATPAQKPGAAKQPAKKPGAAKQPAAKNNPKRQQQNAAKQKRKPQ
ncbi:MAG: hypothetical protein PHU80_02980 [Kiritimatiellae bacterium]|nr:hypothetical protein [Kiritimatiellia bacterium]